MEWKWYVGKGLWEWDGRFKEENNDDEGCGGIYNHNDDEEVFVINNRYGDKIWFSSEEKS